MKRECRKEESIQERGGGPERSRAEGEEKETLSYIGPNVVIPVSSISLNKLSLFQSAELQPISNGAIEVCGISGINLSLSVFATYPESICRCHKQ